MVLQDCIISGMLICLLNKLALVLLLLPEVNAKILLTAGISEVLAAVVPTHFLFGNAASKKGTNLGGKAGIFLRCRTVGVVREGGLSAKTLTVWNRKFFSWFYHFYSLPLLIIRCYISRILLQYY